MAERRGGWVEGYAWSMMNWPSECWRGGAWCFVDSGVEKYTPLVRICGSTRQLRRHCLHNNNCAFEREISGIVN